jgi:phage terminase large subunit-like protein
MASHRVPCCRSSTPDEIAHDRSDPPAWQDPKNWWMVTPNRDRSVSIPRLEEDWEKAKLKGQGEIVRWASQHLNIEIGLALRSDRWAGADYWEQAADKSLTLDEVLARSEVVVIGVDGGGLDDLLGLAVLGRAEKTRQWMLWSKAWARPRTGTPEGRSVGPSRLRRGRRARYL